MDMMNQVFVYYSKFSEKMKKEVTSQMTVFGKEAPNPQYFEMSGAMQAKVLKYMQDMKNGVQNEKIVVESKEDVLSNEFEEKKLELVEEDSNSDEEYEVFKEIAPVPVRNSNPSKIEVDEFQTAALNDLLQDTSSPQRSS